MRVLHVIPSLSTRTGGPPVAVVDSALALREIGVEPTIFASDMGASASSGTSRRVTADELPRGAHALDVRLFPVVPPGRLVFSPSMYRELQRSAHAYDLIHVHSLFLFPQFAAYRAARRAGVPYVVSPRGAFDPYLRQRNRTVKAISDRLWQRRFIERAAMLHLTSDEEARQIGGLGLDVPRAIVPNGVCWHDFERLPSPDAFRRQWCGGSDLPLVLFMGRIARKKGIDLLIQALSRARATAGDAWLVIAGPDDEGLTPALRQLALREGPADRVVFTGMLRDGAKLAALAAADVWALPSRGENFGNAVVEAMAASRAVVVSPEVNITPAIDAAGAGVIVPRTADAFAGALASLLQDKPRRRRLGEAARVFARQYDWANVAPQLKAMYERTVVRERAAA